MGYNGIERLLGIFGSGAVRSANRQNNPDIPPAGGGGVPPNRNSLLNNYPTGRANIPRGSPPPPGRAASGPTNGIGQAEALRLFLPPLSKEASWLIPVALFSILIILTSHHLTLPLAFEHQAVVLWGGWLVTSGIFFSIAGFFHEYYLSTLAPPMAALVGIGVVETWRIAQKRHWLATTIIVAITALTIWLQYYTAKNFSQNQPWMPLVIGLFVIGVVILIAMRLLHTEAFYSLAQIGFISLVSAILVTPTVWSMLTNLHPSSNQSLPAAYDGSSNGPINSGRLAVNTQLLDYLEANTRGIYYLMAVPSSMQGADYVLATGHPVLYMGGFMGRDEVLTPESLASIVKEGKLRYIYWTVSTGSTNGGAGFGGQTLINNWVSSQCSLVQGFSTFTRNYGAPDGIQGGTGSGIFPGGMQPMVLYDCGK